MPSLVLSSIAGIDDFVFRADGTLFAFPNSKNLLGVRLGTDSNGTLEVIAGALTSTVLEGVSAGKFGRGPDDANILYMTTSGGKM